MAYKASGLADSKLSRFVLYILQKDCSKGKYLKSNQ